MAKTLSLDQVIERLTALRNSMGGSTPVQVYSEDYYCDIHNIEDITDGWTSNSGWTEHNDVVGIKITK